MMLYMYVIIVDNEFHIVIIVEELNGNRRAYRIAGINVHGMTVRKVFAE